MIQLTPPGMFSVFTAATTLCILAGVLWWLKRSQRAAIPFPLLRHLNLPPSPRLNFVWHRPPVRLFIYFMSAAGLAAALALKPWWLHEQPSTPSHVTAPSYLWIIDLSPSVSARINHTEYSKLLQAYADSLPPTSSITILTSSKRQPEPAIRADQFRGLSEEFHRGGFSGSQLLTELSAKLTAYDATIIFTDGAADSWPLTPATLAASALYQAHNVQFQLISPQKSASENIFVSWLEPPTASDLTFKFTLTRRLLNQTAPVPATRGRLLLRRGWVHPHTQLTWSDQPASTVPYALPAQSHNLTLSIPAPAATAPPALPAGAEPIIHLEIRPVTADLISLDNHYYAALKPSHQLVLIGPTLGESMVGDPLHPHLMSLPLLGYNTTRLDSWNPAAGAAAATTMLFITSQAAARPNLTCTPPPASLQHVIILPAKHWVPPRALCVCLKRLLGALTQAPPPLGCPDTLNTPAELATHLLDHSFKTLITAAAASTSTSTAAANLTIERPVALRRRLLTPPGTEVTITVAVQPLDPYHQGTHSLTTHGNLISVLKRILTQPPHQNSPATAAAGEPQQGIQPSTSLSNVPQRESILLPAPTSPQPRPPRYAPAGLTAATSQGNGDKNPIPMLMTLLLSALILLELSCYRSATSGRAQAATLTP